MAEIHELKKKREKKQQRRRIAVCWGGSQHNTTTEYIVSKQADCGLIGDAQDLLNIVTEAGDSVTFPIGSVMYWTEKDEPDAG